MSHCIISNAPKCETLSHFKCSSFSLALQKKMQLFSVVDEKFLEKLYFIITCRAATSCMLLGLLFPVLLLLEVLAEYAFLKKRMQKVSEGFFLKKAKKNEKDKHSKSVE